MKIIYNIRILFYVLLSGLFLLSCGSSQMMVKKTTASELSRKLGIPVTHKDDLELYSAAADWMGVPYKYGGTSKKGVDCSGLVNIIYSTVYGIHLERKAEDIYKKNCTKVSPHNLKAGDLVFFDTKNNRKTVTHIGIYLKDQNFIHASTSKGVKLNSLNEKYFKKSLIRGGKVKK